MEQGFPVHISYKVRQILTITTYWLTMRRRALCFVPGDARARIASSFLVELGQGVVNHAPTKPNHAALTPRMRGARE